MSIWTDSNAALKDITVKQQGLLMKADAQKRGLTPEEEMEYQTLQRSWDHIASHTSLNEPIKILPKTQQDQMEAARKNKMERTEHATSLFNRDNYVWNPRGVSQRDIYNRYLAFGEHALGPEEVRGLQGDLGTAGGFLITPIEVANNVFVDLDNECFVRKLATIIRVEHSETFSVPTLDGDFSSPTWTAELSSGGTDTSMDFEARNFTPRPFARKIKVSFDFLRISKINPESFVNSRIVQVCAQVLENAYMVGTGPGPIGLFTASDSGISTARDITASSTTEIKMDDLINAIGALKYQWRKNAVWICHRNVETQLRKLRDGMGRPLLENSIDGKRPPNLLGFPLYCSEYAPSVMTSEKYGIILGDMRYFWIIDQMALEIKRLTELYAETNELGIIVRYSGDGNAITENAFVRIKFA